MNSIEQLNNFGQTSVTYTDNRDPGVYFNQSNGTDQYTVLRLSQNTLTIPNGIEIISIIDPNAYDVYMDVGISEFVGSSVTWPTIPSGLTVTNPNAGLFRISNIDTVEQWNAIKNPVLTVTNPLLPFDRSQGRIVVTIRYNPSKSKTYYVYVDWSFVAQLSSTFNLTGRLSGIQQGRANLQVAGAELALGLRIKKFTASISATSTATILASSIKRTSKALSMTASMTTTATTVKRITKELTASATISNIAIANNPYNVSSVTYSGGLPFEDQMKAWSYGPYRPYASFYEYYDYYKTSNYYVRGIYTTSGTSTPNARVFNFSAGTWSLQQDIKYFDGLGNPIYPGFGRQVALNSTGDKLAVCDSSSIYIHTRSGSTWSLVQTISVGSTIFPNPNSALDMSMDGNYIAVGGSFTGNDIKIYKYNFGTGLYALETTLDNLIPDYLRLSDDGSYLIGASPYDTMKVWSRSGTTWTAQTIAVGFDSITACAISPTGAYACAITSTGIVRTYDKSGSNWNLSDTLYPEGLGRVGGFDTNITISLDGSIQVTQLYKTLTYTRIV
jgi:hypothetical protein